MTLFDHEYEEETTSIFVAVMKVKYNIKKGQDLTYPYVCQVVKSRTQAKKRKKKQPKSKVTTTHAYPSNLPMPTHQTYPSGHGRSSHKA